MSSKNETTDRRISRTRQSIRNALIGLILEKHYDTITVQDIIEKRANVGRSTFYLHFRDKEDLFRGDWQRMILFFIEQINHENLEKGRIFPIEGLFNHLKDFHHLYRALVKSGKIEQLFSYGQKYLREQIKIRIEILVREKTQPTIPIAILANYLSTEVFSNLKWWLDNDMPYSAEEMDRFFHQLILSGFRIS